MRRAHSGRVAGISAALGLVVALLVPATVLADPPTRIHETGLTIECPVIVTPDGSASAFASALSDGFGEAAAVFWTESPPGENDPPLLEGFGEATATGLTIEATFTLFDTNEGVPAGEATLTATLTPVGEPIPFEERSRHFRQSGTTQDASVAGSMSIEAEGVTDGPVSFDLSECGGFITETDLFIVNPGTFQDFHREVELFCELETDGASAILSGFQIFFDEFSFGAAGAEIAVDGGPTVGGGSDTLLTPEGMHGTFELSDFDSGEVFGEAEVSATFTPDSVLRGVRVAQNYRQKMLVTQMSVTGTLTAVIGEDTFVFSDLSSCVASDIAFHGIFHSPAGPQPGGRVPSNDTPDGARALELGDQVQMQTRGASLVPEEPCFLTFGEEVVENFWGRTVWFTVEGTGDPITIDPTGSNFDTAIAAYVQTGEGFEQVACIDDDFSSPFQDPQAPLTFDTQEGVTYYIQVGGFDEGSLFDEEPRPEYGRLRLRVR